MRQEDLAEAANLSPNYIGAIERGEKIPALETLLVIMNVLEVSSQTILCEVVRCDYKAKECMLYEKTEKLPKQYRELIYAVVDTLTEKLEEQQE